MMISFGLIFSLIFGALIGSFLNVLILRYHTGRSLAGRSGCLSCGRKLPWFELLPIVSFFALGRKCRGCQSKISWQYPLVEAGTGALFALAWFIFAPAFGLVAVYWCVAAASVFIFAYDLRHQIVPDSALWFLAAASAARIGFGGPGLLESLSAGAIFGAVFWALWYFSGGRWLGFGDAKLVFCLGLLLGLSAGIIALALAFWLGALVGLTLIGISRLGKLRRNAGGYTMKSEVPFAPFLLIGAWVAIIFQLNIFF